jgi:predicted GNAT superfamily acetyltransferase
MLIFLVWADKFRTTRVRHGNDVTGQEKVARYGGLVNVDWIECRLCRSIRKTMMNAESEPMISLRRVEASDLVSILQLNETAVPAVNSIDLAQMRWFTVNAAYFGVAARDGDVAGFLVGMRPGTDYGSPNYRWFCSRYDEFGYIDRVVIAEDARRLGLATRLYRDFEASLSATVDILACEVNIVPPNESSMRFHEDYGFRTVGTQTLENGRKTVALMAKELNA